MVPVATAAATAPASSSTNILASHTTRRKRSAGTMMLVYVSQWPAAWTRIFQSIFGPFTRLK